MRRPAAALGLALIAAIASHALVGALVEAQEEAQEEPVISERVGAALDEERAFGEAQQGHHIKAREIAERVVRADPESYIGHFVLGFVHHYGEANFARALYHHNRARQLFAAEHGAEEAPPAQWRWEARILRELAATHGDLEHYREQLRYMAVYSDLYEPDYQAELAWPLMKLRRFDDAREAAELGRASGDPRQVEVALNALCAVEFEAGRDEVAYGVCREAMELHGGDPAAQSAVDFTNFAEAARSVFRLDEAERAGQLATEAQTGWYGNPWQELGELYIREARFVEALAALREVPRYRTRRPPHVRDADRNESRRALTSFFLVIGRADDALGVAEKALTAPDRRAHSSRDPLQDHAIAALLHRAALRLRAERTIEDAAGGSVIDEAVALASATRDRASAWLSGRGAARALADDERLVGTFMIGTHRSAVMPPWLAPELVGVVGAGVVTEAVRRARREDRRDGAPAYYDAFEAEAAMARGDPTRARELADRALAALDPAEALSRARLHAIVAQASRDLGDARRATEAYGDAFQTDPGVIRRLGWTVPARFESSGGIAEDVADAIAGGPRFDRADWGLLVRVRGDRTGLVSCLVDAGDSELGCADTRARADGEDEAGFVRRAVAELHAAAFAPRVDLSQTDANGLDGSNRLSRDPLDTLLGGQGDLEE